MSARPHADAHGPTLVLICGDLAPRLELDDVRARLPGTSVVVVEGLCNSPRSAAAALRAHGANRAVVGLCTKHVSTADLLTRTRRAGADPFGVLTVSLAAAARASSAPAAARTLAGAVARVEALPPGDDGRAVFGRVPLSRGGLLSLGGAVTIEPVASVDRRACIGTTRCGLCIDACPPGAIVADGDVVSIDTGRCDTCGRCVPVCPTGAFHLAGNGAGQIEAELDAVLPATGVAFRCRHAWTTADELPTTWTTVELPSLAPVTTGWILQALAAGATAVRLLPCGGACCSEIAERSALCQTVLTQLGDRDPAARVAVLETADEARPAPLDRISTNPANAGIVLVEPQATVDALNQLGSVLPGELTELAIDDPASPLGRLALDVDACTLCGSCAVVCPTHALTLDTTDGDHVLHHDPRLCTGCKICVAACPEHALSVRPGFDGAHLEAGIRELVRSARSICRRCGCELPAEPTARRVRELLAERWPSLAAGTAGLCAECESRTAPR